MGLDGDLGPGAFLGCLWGSLEGMELQGWSWGVLGRPGEFLEMVIFILLTKMFDVIWIVCGVVCLAVSEACSSQTSEADINYKPMIFNYF